MPRPSLLSCDAACRSAANQRARQCTCHTGAGCALTGASRVQTEHARRATQFAYQGHTSATNSAAASVILGEIYGSMGNHGAALSAFTTAMTVLTQHGLRTRQGGAVMRHIGRCFMQQEEFRRARSHLGEVHPRRVVLPAAPCMHLHGSDGPR